LAKFYIDNGPQACIIRYVFCHFPT